MRTKFVLLIAMAGMFTFSSCKKCFTCQGNNSVYTEEICKPANMNQKGWNEYVKDYEENYNATCN